MHDFTQNYKYETFSIMSRSSTYLETKTAGLTNYSEKDLQSILFSYDPDKTSYNIHDSQLRLFSVLKSENKNQTQIGALVEFTMCDFSGQALSNNIFCDIKYINQLTTSGYIEKNNFFWLELTTFIHTLENVMRDYLSNKYFGKIITKMSKLKQLVLYLNSCTSNLSIKQTKKILRAYIYLNSELLFSNVKTKQVAICGNNKYKYIFSVDNQHTLLMCKKHNNVIYCGPMYSASINIVI